VGSTKTPEDVSREFSLMVIGSFFLFRPKPASAANLAPPSLDKLNAGSAESMYSGGERQPIRSHYFRSALKLSPILLIFVVVVRT
jgi:hypothetical protein